ncbi:MAG: hypothetical protein GF344_12250 [Chitinivibrionales bacterium]|nr:hypothetical protein [Chitinivibrionales bacterium]MBD3357542.1 hypothetical protein [Chitinivibrionales bacterium]
MADAKSKWIDEKLGEMDLDQKVGQMMVFGFCGPIITPDTVEMITKYHVGGIRISQGYRAITLYNDIKPGEEPDAMTLRSMHSPKGMNKDYISAKNPPRATASEYAGVLNKLRKLSIDRKAGIPIHFTVDQEGSGSDDLLGGQRLFPHPMGLAASGDPSLAYRVALAVGKQARAVGGNMIHSPVLDVNTNPRNPEIGTRAYGDTAETVTEYALQSLKGFQEAGIVCTGKHFPGRGESMADAHWGLPSVDLDRETLMRVHIAPYRALIEAGLPAIMTAHSLFPALGVTEKPAGMTRALLHDFLRGELGFDGVITTDNMMMGGILKQYEMSEAIVQTLIAGNDLVLCRDESPIRLKILESVKQAVRDGRLPEKEVDEKVRRIMAMRWDMGLADNGGLVEEHNADEVTRESFVVDTAEEAARRSVLPLRDDANALPLRPEQRVLLIEQIFPTHAAQNNLYCHPGLLWEEMRGLSSNVGSIEIENVPGEKDRQRVKRRIEQDDYDILVCTNYYYHKAAAAISDVVRELMATGKPVIVVANTPYEFAVEPDFPTAVVCFQPGGRENMRAVARILYGDLKPTAKLPVVL